MEQSTLGETSKGKVIPQFAGRDFASPEFTFMLLETFLRQVQAVCLSAVVVAADARVAAPAQHGDGGAPLPFFRYSMQGLRSLITSLHVRAAAPPPISKTMPTNTHINRTTDEHAICG